jgi:pyruvate/2-oxoacid:ferredoxin oxidoreductase alpha subunit
MGSIAAEARVAVDGLRERGHSVGLLRVRFFRPFPIEEISRLCAGREDVLVIDRDYSYGLSGALYSEVKSVLYGHTSFPVRNLIMGIGGRDVTHGLIARMATKAWEGKLDDITWADSHTTASHRVTREMLERFKKILD